MSVQPLVVPLSGGRSATLTPAAKDFPERVHIRIEGGGMTPYTEARWLVGSGAARRGLARNVNISDAEADQIAAHVEPWALQAQQQLQVDATPADDAPATQPYGLLQRLITQPVSEAAPYPTVATPEEVVLVLQRGGVEPNTVLEWDRDQIDRLVVLDLDFHDPTKTKPKPTEAELDQLGYDLSPAPWIWWRTHGGGLKALYATIPHTPYTANELAAGAAAQCLCTPMVVRCGGTAELLTRTRHPTAIHNGKACGPTHLSSPTDRFACLQRFSAAGATEEEIADLLDDNGFTIGQRLDHTFCVIDPGHPSLSAPVIVTETGLFCHSCSGRLGYGFTSWGSVRRKFGLTTSLADGEVAPIINAIRHFVHFKHVDYLMDVYAPEIATQYRTLLYSALLKNQHGSDPRISGVFSEFAFVRGVDCWLHQSTLLPASRLLNMADVGVLPSVKVLDADEEPMVSQAKVSSHTNNGYVDGWTPIQPNLFVPIFAHFNTPTTTHHAALCRPKKMLGGRRHVTYLSPDKRVAQAIAEQRISDFFPGVSITYLKALIIAMGCGESGAGMPPMLWATGPTEAAKTTTSRIVLEMLGERFQSMSEIPEDRLDQIFGEALDSSRLILFDDFAKNPEDYKRLHTFFIRINRGGHVYHGLRVGKREPPVNSAILLTDWRTPAYFMNDPQFGRRVHIVRLNKIPNSWEGLNIKVEKWWLKTPEIQQAAETFFSNVIDDFFPDGDQEGFDNKMARLGIHRVVDEAGDVAEQKVSLRELVHQLVVGICTTESKNAIDERRLGKGFCEIIWRTQGTVSEACTALVDSLGLVKMNSESLNHVLEQFKNELQEIFHLDAPATLQIKDYGSRTFIRLVEEGIKTHSRSKRINKELFTSWPPVLNGHTNGHSHPVIDTVTPIEPTQSFDRYREPAILPAVPAFDPLPNFPGIPTIKATR